MQHCVSGTISHQSKLVKVMKGRCWRERPEKSRSVLAAISTGAARKAISSQLVVRSGYKVRRVSRDSAFDTLERNHDKVAMAPFCSHLQPGRLKLSCSVTILAPLRLSRATTALPSPWTLRPSTWCLQVVIMTVIDGRCGPLHQGRCMTERTVRLLRA